MGDTLAPTQASLTLDLCTGTACMFDPTFYTINEHFDGNLTNYVSFVPHRDYVLRFVVDGWEPQQPDPPSVLAAALSVGQVLGNSGDLAVYETKGFCLQHVPQGKGVGFYDPSWYSIPWGSGYTDELMAGDATWTFDMVFRPKMGENTWTSVSKWTQILSGMLVGSRGMPRVKCAGLITLDPGTSISEPAAAVGLAEAITFWSSRQAFWEFRASADEREDGTHVVNYAKINAHPGLAWNRHTEQLLGHDGFGVAKGSAFSPYSLVPLQVGSALPAVTPAPLPVEVPGSGPAPASGWTWKTAPTAYKVGGAIVGAAAVTALVTAFRKMLG